MNRFTVQYATAALALLALPLTGCSQDPAQTAAKDGDDFYTYTDSNYDGIGKTYMGRDISYVMGHQGAGWLERKVGSRRNALTCCLPTCLLSPVTMSRILVQAPDISAYPWPRIVGDNGTVYSVDIQPEMLAIIEARSNEMGIKNVTRVLATEKDPQLPVRHSRFGVIRRRVS